MVERGQGETFCRCHGQKWSVAAPDLRLSRRGSQSSMLVGSVLTRVDTSRAPSIPTLPFVITVCYRPSLISG